MSAGHSHRLYCPGDSGVHRLPPQCKLAGAVTFVLVVVATPRAEFWAFGVYAGLLAALLMAARIPIAFVLRRMTIELPFVAFAFLVPFVARGPQVEIAGIALSHPGLLDAWNILAKATIGVLTAVLLAATTEPRDILRGAERLRLPPTLAQIATFMLRYVDVVLDDLRRMRMARESRGFVARGPRAWATLAHTAGALFIRSYERGERVYLAMLSRGYTGVMPAMTDGPATRTQWATAATLPLAAAAVAAAAGFGA